MSEIQKKEQELARVLGQKIASGDPALLKEASASIDRFIRKRLTETSVMDQILEPEKIGPEDLHDSVYGDDKLYVMMEIEPDFPGAMSFAFNSPTPMMTMGIRRVLTSIDRIQSFRMQKEVVELLRHYVSLRDINADYQLKNVLRQFDARAIACINRAVGPVPGQVMAPTGSIHYHEMAGGLTSQNLAESLKFIPKLGHELTSNNTWGAGESGLSAQTMLMNNVTYQEFAHWQYPVVGPEIGTDVIKNGLTSFKSGVLGLKIVVSVKRNLIPDGTVYQLADPKFIGKCLVFQEPTMHVHQQDHMVSFYIDAMRGGGIFLFSGLARVDFLGV